MRIAILGLGQLGGSLALAIKSAYPNTQIDGYDANAAHAEALRASGGVDTVFTSPEEAVHRADILFLAAPLSTYDALAQRIAAHIPAGCIISDVGSAQQCLHRVFSAHTSLNVIPSHPIAGSERDGPDAARADLFTGRLVLLTPHDPHTNAAKKLAEFWHGLSTNIVFMPPDIHDAIYAHVSHLPHLLIFAAAQCLHDAGVSARADDAMLRQSLRIGMSNVRMWRDVFIENAPEISFALAQIIAIIRHMVTELESAPDNEEAPAEQAQIMAQFLPRVVASALISCVQMFEETRGINLKHFAGAGLRDATAPATIDPESELAAMSTHAKKLAHCLHAYLQVLSGFDESLKTADRDTIEKHITSARESAFAVTQAPHAQQ